MATETTSIGDKPLKIFYEGASHELIIRVRDGSPSLGNVAMNNLIRATLKTWMNAWRGALGELDVTELPSAIESLELMPSANEPYVTIFNKSYDGLSITVHDHSKPQTVVNLATAYREAITIVRDKLPSLFEIGQAPQAKQAPPSQAAKEPIQFPSGETSADVLDSGETVAFRASKPDGNDYMIETGKRDSVAWKEVTKATKPYDRSKVEHSDGELVAYFVNAPLTVKAPNGKVCMEVGTSGGKFTFWQSKRDSDEQTFDWQSIETQMYGVNVLAEQLTDGFKLNMPCLLIVKFTHSGGKEYANFYGFRALPQKQAIAS